MFRFYFRSLQWLCFHVCNPQIICLKKQKPKNPNPKHTQHPVIEQLCGFYTYVGNMRGSLFQNFLSPQYFPCFWFFHSLHVSPKSLPGLVSHWLLHFSWSLCPSVSFLRLWFWFSQASAVSCAEVQNMCMETQSLFGLHSKSRFLDLKTFFKKIYLICVANSWVPDGSNAVLISVLV